MALHEIVLEETKPETEWVRGRALQKVSPTYRHALAQRRLVAALGEWVDHGGPGRVGTEWRFRVTPPGAITRPLVPDVAYVAFAVLPDDALDHDVEIPRVPPTVAFEVLSADDRDDDVADKIAVYLAAGTTAVVIVDPERRNAVVIDRTGMRVVEPGQTLSHPALPGFAVDVSALFARLP